MVSLLQLKCLAEHQEVVRMMPMISSVSLSVLVLPRTEPAKTESFEQFFLCCVFVFFMAGGDRGRGYSFSVFDFFFFFFQDVPECAGGGVFSLVCEDFLQNV